MTNRCHRSIAVTFASHVTLPYGRGSVLPGTFSRMGEGMQGLVSEVNSGIFMGVV
jgi:hypothetical protein